eukprot:3688570-Pleurochrysis_carterae.AAC.1
MIEKYVHPDERLMVNAYLPTGTLLPADRVSLELYVSSGARSSRVSYSNFKIYFNSNVLEYTNQTTAYPFFDAVPSNTVLNSNYNVLQTGALYVQSVPSVGAEFLAPTMAQLHLVVNFTVKTNAPSGSAPAIKMIEVFELTDSSNRLLHPK